MWIVGLLGAGVAASIASWVAFVRGRRELARFLLVPAVVALSWSLLALSPDVQRAWQTDDLAVVVVVATLLAVGAIAAQLAIQSVVERRGQLAVLAGVVAVASSSMFAVGLALLMT